MQVILDSSFACPGSAPIWGGKKGEFRDWTRGHQSRSEPEPTFLSVMALSVTSPNNESRGHFAGICNFSPHGGSSKRQICPNPAKNMVLFDHS